MRTFTDSCFLLSVLVCAVFLSGCGEKKEREKAKEKHAEIVALKLKDGTEIKINATEFGISDFPPGDYISFEKAEDTRHLIDEKGVAFTQPVYRQELIMETDDHMENLIKFFFPKTPYIVNRRKQAGQDVYVRLVSSKDTSKIQALEEPYTVIDMVISYPRAEKEETPPKPLPTVTPLQDQISGLRSQIELLKQSLDQGALSIPERRTFEGQIVTLEEELAKLISIRDTQKIPESENENAVKPINKVSKPKIKIKILSYMKRS